ncbi:hypothetical protein [Methylobacterium platani]|nr:hypothetical protein [Methylobacterium platani]
MPMEAVEADIAAGMTLPAAHRVELRSTNRAALDQPSCARPTELRSTSLP